MLRSSIRIAAVSLALCACEGNDSSIHLTWQVNGDDATLDRCEAVGAAWVRILIDDDGDDDTDRYSRDMPCMNGAGETLKIFQSDENYQVKFELRGELEVKAQDPETGWLDFSPDKGTNEMSASFTVATP